MNVRKKIWKAPLLNANESDLQLLRLADRYQISLQPETPHQEQDIHTLARLRWYAGRYATLMETAIGNAAKFVVVEKFEDPASRMIALHAIAEEHLHLGTFFDTWCQIVKLQNTVAARVDRWYAAKNKPARAKKNPSPSQDQPHG
jgi:hypothetical protein